MTISSDLNGAEFHGVVLRAHFRRREQEAQDLRIGRGGPASDEEQKKENQHPSEQTVEEIKGGGAQAHGEEEKLSLGPQDRERPGKRSRHAIDSSGFGHLRLHWELEKSTARKEPRQEVHRGDRHPDTEQDTGQHAFRAAFAECKGKTGNDDGHKREAAGDGAGESG